MNHKSRKIELKNQHFIYLFKFFFCHLQCFVAFFVAKLKKEIKSKKDNNKNPHLVFFPPDVASPRVP